PADEREGEVGGALRQGVSELRAVDESRHVIKHGGTKQSFDRFQNERSAVGAGDGQVAPEEKPEIASYARHWREPPSIWAVLRPVSRRKTSSRVDELVRFFNAAGVSQSSKRPRAMTTMRSASNSTSGSVWEAKSREVPASCTISFFKKRRNSIAAMASRLRVGSSSKR